MNNEIAPILDILEELKQECKVISKAQIELHTAFAEQPTNSKSERKRPYKFISQKRRKLKSRNTNFLFWRHSRNQTRNSTRSLKPCNCSLKSNKSP